MANKYKQGKYRLSVAGNKDLQNKPVAIYDPEGNDVLDNIGNSYDGLTNKPTINGVELEGNMRFVDIVNGLAFGGVVYHNTVITPDESCYYITNDTGEFVSFGIEVYSSEKVQMLYYDTNYDGWVADELPWYRYGYMQGKVDTLDGIATLLEDIVPTTASSSNKLLTENERHFKGWWPDLATLKAAYAATEGDSAYVKDASPATTWSIYVYDSTASSDNYWADSGTDADTSNVQTFASSEEVNEVHIVNDLITGGVTDVLSAEQGKKLANEIVKDELLSNEAYRYIPINFDCTNIVTGKCLRPSGYTLNVSNGAYCQDYLPVIGGMKIMYQASGTGTVAAILCYDENKTIISGSLLQIGSDVNYREWTIPEGVSYIRISTETYTTRGLGCYVKADKKLPDIVSLEERASDLEEFHTNDDSYRLNTDEDFYISDSGINPFALNNPTFLPKFKPSTPKIEFKYRGQLNNEKRYATLGFDDFRISDFAYMIPMLNKYDAKAEFNLIKYYTRNTSKATLDKEKQKVLQCAFNGQEIGDHSFYHEKFPFSDPMWNGQNPSSLDGTQVPFPSNDQMRVDVGNGKNYFGISLSSKPYSDIKYQGQSITHTYANLTDDECQAIRNWYSLFGDINDEATGETGHSNLLRYLDTLSNMYLGTTGNSKGSWVDVEGETNGGHYTGGIYTGMHSSANEEIWERYMQLVDIYTKDLYGYNGRIRTWSMPGSKSSSNAYFFFYGTDPNFPNAKYYDIERTKPLNYNARWESATLKNPDGTPKVRSMTELLREFGYIATHDYEIPGRDDELGRNAYEIKFYPNADLSQINGVGRFNNYELYDADAGTSITNADWFVSEKQRETEMYDRISWYRGAVEVFRQYTGGGRFAGLIADTQSDSTKIYGYMSVFEGLVRYCKSAGIELLTTQEAYDVAFNHRLDNENLIYNPCLRNTAKEFLVGEDTNTNYQVEDNPDGYYGSCSVEKDEDDCNVNVLVTTGNVRYEHWGIPYGHLEYIADVKGEGTVTIYEFKNKTALETWNPQGTTIAAKRINLSDCGSSIADKTISSASDFTEQKIEFTISDNDLEAWNDRTEELGNKVIGIIIVYSTGLRVKNIRLNKIK